MDPQHEGVRFERQDVEPRAVVRFGIVLAVVTILVSGVLVYMLGYFAKLEARQDPPPAPLARHEPGRLPPEPRLQRNPFADIERMREEQERVLTSYGWVDQQAGVARIPIEDAMAAVAERLPARPPATPAQVPAAAGGAKN